MLLANRAILGHVASCLPHEPDRGTVNRLTLAGAHEVGIRGGHEWMNVAFLEKPCCDRRPRHNFVRD
jgi:hypothetical protein